MLNGSHLRASGRGGAEVPASELKQWTGNSNDTLLVSVVFVKTIFCQVTRLGKLVKKLKCSTWSLA